MHTHTQKHAHTYTASCKALLLKCFSGKHDVSTDYRAARLTVCQTLSSCLIKTDSKI